MSLIEETFWNENGTLREQKQDMELRVSRFGTEGFWETFHVRAPIQVSHLKDGAGSVPKQFLEGVPFRAGGSLWDTFTSWHR